jgi:hypothetical protein
VAIHLIRVKSAAAGAGDDVADGRRPAFTLPWGRAFDLTVILLLSNITTSKKG